MEFMKGGIIGNPRIFETHRFGWGAEGRILSYTRDKWNIPFITKVVQYGVDKLNVEEKYQAESKLFIDFHQTTIDSILSFHTPEGIMCFELPDMSNVSLIRLGMYIGGNEADKIKDLYRKIIFEKHEFTWEELWEKTK